MGSQQVYVQFSMHSTLLRAQMKDTQGSRPAGQFPGCALQQVSVSPLQNGLFSESSAKRGPEKAKATMIAAMAILGASLWRAVADMTLLQMGDRMRVRVASIGN